MTSETCCTNYNSRELRRNKNSENLYLPDTAQQLSDKRKQESKREFGNITEETIQAVKNGFKKRYSPEQIAGRLKREKKKSVSHETIYKMICKNHQECGKHEKYLRQGKKKRKKRKSKNAFSMGIPNRVGIENRPKIVEEKKEIGHGESDTMIGGNHSGALVTHVDKTSKFLVAALGKDKSIKKLNKVTIKLFNEIDKEKLKTFTCDNGKEFSGHEELSKVLLTPFYFANPYCSWERGLNEHTNGLLRQFFPKGINFKIVKPEEVKKAVDLINNRP